MSFDIRKATPDDHSQLAHLFNAYRVFYNQPSDPQAAADFLRTRQEKGESHILVAEAGEAGRAGELAGFTQLYPLFSSVAMTPMLLLNDLFVAPDHRRRGIARALLDAAVAFGRAQGAAKLILETGVDNQAARALYQAAGWRLIDENCFYERTTDTDHP